MFEIVLSGKYNRSHWIISRILAIVVSILAIYASLFFFTDMTVSDIVNIVGIIVNGILTFILVVLYDKIIDVNEDQLSEMEEQRKGQYKLANIQERQQKLMEAELVPTLSVENIHASGDRLTLGCKNEGPGVARDLRVRMNLFVFFEKDVKSGINLVDHELRKDTENGTRITEFIDIFPRPLTKKSQTHVSDDPLQGSSLQANDSTSFVGTPTVWCSIGSQTKENGTRRLAPNHMRINETIDTLVDHGVCWIGYVIEVYYKNTLDEECGPHYAKSKVVEVEDGDNIHNILEKESIGTMRRPEQVDQWVMRPNPNVTY